MSFGKAIVNLLALACRVAVGLLFVYAAYLKLGNIQKFADGIKAYDVLPEHLVYVSAFAFPWIEMLAGVMLVLGLWSRASALVCSLLLCAFLFAIASVLQRDIDVPECSCFGKEVMFCKGPPSTCHLGQDVILLAMAAVPTIAGGGWLSLDGLIRRRRVSHPAVAA